MRWIAMFLALLLLVGCSATQPPGPPKSQVSRLEITPAGVLLTTDAPSQTLSVRVLDPNGQVIKAAVSWSSSDPSVVSVSQDGLVTAHADLGSARITAQAGGVKADIIAVIARLVAGAVLVSDEQIVATCNPLTTRPSSGWAFNTP